MADPERQIPQWIQDRLHNVFIELVAEKQKQIQIRFGMKRAATVTSNREQGKPSRGRAIVLPPDLKNDVVYLSAGCFFEGCESGLIHKLGSLLVEEPLQFRTRCHQIHARNGITGYFTQNLYENETTKWSELRRDH